MRHLLSPSKIGIHRIQCPSSMDRTDFLCKHWCGQKYYYSLLQILPMWRNRNGILVPQKLESPGKCQASYCSHKIIKPFSELGRMRLASTTSHQDHEIWYASWKHDRIGWNQRQHDRATRKSVLLPLLRQGDRCRTTRPHLQRPCCWYQIADVKVRYGIYAISNVHVNSWSTQSDIWEPWVPLEAHKQEVTGSITAD